MYHASWGDRSCGHCKQWGWLPQRREVRSTNGFYGGTGAHSKLSFRKTYGDFKNSPFCGPPNRNLYRIPAHYTGLHQWVGAIFLRPGKKVGIVPSVPLCAPPPPAGGRRMSLVHCVCEEGPDDRSRWNAPAMWSLKFEKNDRKL